jgi:hypothetical protein
VIEQSLRAAPPGPSPGQALALAKLSVLSFWLGDFTRSSATSALGIGAAVGDTRSQALALSRLGALVILGDPAAGDPMLLRAAELARTAGDLWGSRTRPMFLTWPFTRLARIR